MIPPQEAYDDWSSQYDTNQNRTRDLEAHVLRSTLGSLKFDHVLEIGCGTGKNTLWLVERAKHITAVDLSAGMLSVARGKINSPAVRFVQADILQPWTFVEGRYDLVTFSLVLEHIEHLGPMFQSAAANLTGKGHVYVGELHPFKQYIGTKARFTTESGPHVVRCFDHHTSDYLQAASAAGFRLASLCEHFDAGDRRSPPRILSLLLQRS